MVWMFVLLLAACTPAGQVQVPMASGSTPVVLAHTSRVSPIPTATFQPVPVQPTLVEPFEVVPSLTPSPLPPVCTSWREIDTAFVTDVGLQDDTRLPPRKTIVKTWRVRNTGSCVWPEGMQLVDLAGTPLSGVEVMSFSHPAPGGETDLSIVFSTPGRLGKYESFWRLRAPGGRLVGAVLFVRFVVDANAEYQPGEVPDSVVQSTETPAPLVPSPSPTPTVMPPAATLTPLPTPTLFLSPSPAALAPTLTAVVDDDPDCRWPDSRFTPVMELATSLQLKSLCALDSVKEETGFLQHYWPEALISSLARSTPAGATPAPPTARSSFVMLAPEAGRVTIFGSKDRASLLATFATYESSWQPTMPERSPTCAILVPPPGAVFPTEAIGVVWCAESLWLTLGWPMFPPIPARIATQRIRDGLLMELRADSDRYLVAVDYEQRRAIVHHVP
jgi:hypothetical protein